MPSIVWNRQPTCRKLRRGIEEIYPISIFHCLPEEYGSLFPPCFADGANSLLQIPQQTTSIPLLTFLEAWMTWRAKPQPASLPVSTSLTSH